MPRFRCLQNRKKSGAKRKKIIRLNRQFKFAIMIPLILVATLVPARAQRAENFVQAMVMLNDNWEEKPEYLMESLNYFYNSNRFSGSKPNNLLFIKAILENPVANNTLVKRYGMRALEKYYQVTSFNPYTVSRELDFNHDICDFKPHYICRLAYEKGFSLLRLFYEDDYKQKNVIAGRVEARYETKDHKVILGIKNSYAFKGSKFFEIDISDKTNIFCMEMSAEPSSSKTSEQLSWFYNFSNQKLITKMTSKFSNQRISYFSKAFSTKNPDLTFIATDAGLSVYDTKSAQLLKFFKNFYTSNDIE
jgi:hypothetical protein